MTNETTPLTEADQTKLHAAGQAISELATPENAKKAGSYAKGKIQQAYNLATDANTPLRVLALLAGLAMITSSIFTAVGKFVNFHLVDTLLSIYGFFFGLIIIILEGKWVPCQRKCQSKISKYALFLDYVWGRGLLYFFAGSLQFIQLNLLDIPVGAFTMCVGFSYYLNGVRTSKKLSELRKTQFSEEELRRRFDEVDVAQKGEIDFIHFTAFIERMGLVLNHNEMVAAFSTVDIDSSSLVEFEEFLLWWRQWDFDAVEYGKVKVEV